jgi:hypothetical protein
MMKAKISFVGGMMIGLLAGSKMGPRLYERVSAAASSLASDPRVRQTATTAGDRAAHAAKNAGMSAAHQVKHAGETVAQHFNDRFGDHVNGVNHHAPNGTKAAVGPFDDPMVD